MTPSIPSRYDPAPSPAARATIVALVAMIVAAMLAMLLFALNPTIVRHSVSAISAIALPAPPPPPPPEPAPQKGDAAAGKASAANRKAKPNPVKAPKPKVKVPPIKPRPAAPAESDGRQADAGAAPNAGPGTGAGGSGDGLGSGGAGRGTGSGGGSKAVWRSGRIKDSDYPDSSSKAKRGGEVETRFTITAEGRVTDCTVTRSSGDPALDATTCRLLEKRFRFKPATNGAGEPIASTYGWRQTWWLEPRGGN